MYKLTNAAKGEIPIFVENTFGSTTRLTTVMTPNRINKPIANESCPCVRAKSPWNEHRACPKDW